MKSRHDYALALSALLLITALVLFFVDENIAGGVVLTLFFTTLAYGVQKNSTLKGFSFALVIFATVSFTLCFPEPFTRWGSFELKKLIVPLMQIIMFGMGTGLGVKDFARVLQMPKGVIVGVLCHYIIMPTIAFTITRIFSFPDEIAAGIILIGSCPNGLASNVMTFLARANLALSVTLTAISTFIAPFVTPFFMQLFAGQYIEVNFMKMMMDILQITILPIAAGLVFNYFLAGKFKVLDAIMPLFSMFAIALIIGVITAAGRNNLLVVGPLLMVAVLIHNISGYFLGYWSSRLLRMKEADCRTIAIEVGMQNGGLASGIALQMGKVATVGLAAVIFSPVMNITGSLLASWWRNKPIEE